MINAEGFSPLSMVLFLVFIGLEAAFYGLGSAIQNVSEADLEKDAEEGNKQAKWLLKVMEQPKYFVYSLQAVTNVIGLILGSYVLRSWGSGLGLWIVKATGWDVKLGQTLGLILAAIVILVVLISFGIVIPKRCGAKKPQYWCYRLVLWVMMSPASLSSNSKMLVIISASLASSTPCSWPSLTIDMISSSVTLSLSLVISTRKAQRITRESPVTTIINGNTGTITAETRGTSR